MNTYVFLSWSADGSPLWFEQFFGTWRAAQRDRASLKRQGVICSRIYKLTLPKHKANP